MIPSSRQQEIDAEQRAWAPGRCVSTKFVDHSILVVPVTTLAIPQRCNLHNDCRAATEHAARFGYEVTHCTRQCDEDCVGEECT